MKKATVLVVEDDCALRDVLGETLQLANYKVRVAGDGEQALKMLQKYQDINLLVSDVQMRPMDGEQLLEQVQIDFPQLPVILMTAYGTVEKAVHAMRHGATDYLVKPFEAETLLSMVERFVPAADKTDSIPMQNKNMDNRIGDENLIAVDPRSQEMVEVALRVAATDVTVMITGESGVGKEVVAQFIHRYSTRSSGPFVAINCAAIPENMLESVLFGYEKGAFTGASQAKAGKFEQAQGGTLLLDEITEMDTGLQAKLLRVLQEREVERLGGRKPIALDVRIIATTNRNFYQVVAEGHFREDLFYRLNVFPLNLLPLRERMQDILPLALRFISLYQSLQPRLPQDGNVLPVSLSSAAKDRLVEHHWPGNVRELDNVMQRALILTSGNRIEASDIHFEQTDNLSESLHTIVEDNRSASTTLATDGHSDYAPAYSRDRIPAKNELSRDLLTHEKELIMSALVSRGSRKAAAEKLGISPRTLRYKLAKLRDAGIAIPA